MTVVALMNPPAHQRPFDTPDVFLTELRQAVKKKKTPAAHVFFLSDANEASVDGDGVSL